MVKKSTKTTSRSATKTPRRVPTTADDVKTAVLLVSVTINLAVFIGWLALKLTSRFDEEVASFLFGN